jgi:rare lipoprotein A
MLFGCAWIFTGCATAPLSKKPPRSAPSIAAPARDVPASSTLGLASYYGRQYNGRKTASGEIYDMRKMTAAHRSLPFGVKVRVTELSANRSVVVRINDRGPFSKGRIIDLSLAAAQRLGIVQTGTATVRLDIVAEAAQRDGSGEITLGALSREE